MESLPHVDPSTEAEKQFFEEKEAERESRFFIRRTSHYLAAILITFSGVLSFTNGQIYAAITHLIALILVATIHFQYRTIIDQERIEDGLINRIAGLQRELEDQDKGENH